MSAHNIFFHGEKKNTLYPSYLTMFMSCGMFQASQLLKSLEIPEIEDKEEVMKELESQIKLAQEATKGNHKTMKVRVSFENTALYYPKYSNT